MPKGVVYLVIPPSRLPVILKLNSDSIDVVAVHLRLRRSSIVADQISDCFDSIRHAVCYVPVGKITCEPDEKWQSS